MTVLMDTSASMPRESLQRGEAMLRDLVRKNSGADLRLITFAEHPKLRRLFRHRADKVSIPQGIDPKNGMASNMEDALQLALSTFPSEGAQTRNSADQRRQRESRTRANRSTPREGARRGGVHGAPAGGTAPLPVKLESIASPQDVFSGEHFTLSLALDSAAALNARVWITSGGQDIGSTKADLQPGSNVVNLEARISQSGVNLMEVHISSASAEQVLVSQAVTGAQSLDVTSMLRAASRNFSRALLDTLKRADVDVEMVTAFPVNAPAKDWDAVLLDNYPDHDLAADEDLALEQAMYMQAAG